MYKKFCDLNINLSAVGLIPGDTKGGYFCTPKGAKVIGWAGVDGIHYCFIKGMGDMVFAVDPMAAPGDYVHPLARNFEDFLRLIITCGDLAAVQQIYAWDKETFDAFLKDNPVTKEQRALLDFMKEKLSLTPMEEPFADIKTLQAAFDYDSIPFKREYYEGIPLAPEVAERRKPKEWKVYFKGDFYENRRAGRAGTEIALEKEFFWNGNDWYIPAMYSCGKGLVLDICVRLEPENPVNVDFRLKAKVNGKEQRKWSGSGIGWMPEACLLPEEENTEEADAVMEHYHLDRTKGWTFRRISIPWVTKTKPVLRTLTLEIEPEMIPVQGPKFVTPQVGESISFQHPITGATHTLTVLDYQREQFPKDRFPMEEFEFPENFTQMTYIVTPEIPKGEYTVKDVCNSDIPKQRVSADGHAACSVGIIGVGAGPTAVFVTGKGTTEEAQVACSALRFEPAETVEWEMIFRRKPCEDIQIKLL